MTVAPTLEDKVRFLSGPDAYGWGAGTVESVETHWSWVFIVDRRVFKLKKPLRRPWIDLTDIGARESNCREELRLNRRLTNGVYRMVVPLMQTSEGNLTLEADGEIVDWLLEMKRLPGSQMLDTLLSRREVSGDDIAAVGRRLVRFYASLPGQVDSGQLYLEHLRTEAEENRRVLGSAEIGMHFDAVRRILDQVDDHLGVVTPLIEERISRSRIVEGHGDLRPEHVCVTRPIQIFDCLEFDRSMRILDPYDEVNYLGLECAFAGAGWIRPQLLEVLDHEFGDRPPQRLMTFYSAFRATLRARICIAHLDDDIPMEPERWPGEASAYLRLAQVELREGARGP